MSKNPYYSGPPSDHFDGVRFFPPGGPRDKSLADLARWMRTRRRPPWPRDLDPVVTDIPPARVEGGAIRLSFVGHSSFLLQTEGVNLLLDPVWAERVGPWGRIGPKRVARPGIALDALPPLDAILVSHNHYDHLDLATLSALARTRPCPVLTPLGNDAILRAHDSRIRASAFDWGQSLAVGPLRVHCEPALHWSARARSDRRMALWASFVIEGPRHKVYFAGDTGHGDGSVFREIAAKHGATRLAILPIGAYAPRWMMQDQHCDPEEAVKIFGALRAEFAFGCHWGTFHLTDEPYGEPVERLNAALAEAGIDAARFAVGPPGSVMELG
jgi:L-ascorbate metabolism protein UlaG (beta-lactamase superfamily)